MRHRFPFQGARRAYWIRTLLVACVTAAALADAPSAIAEGGSAGGAIGGGSGSDSGGSTGGKLSPAPVEEKPAPAPAPRQTSTEPEPPKPHREEPRREEPRRVARPEPSRPEPSRAEPKTERVERGAYDGGWTVYSNSNCGVVSATPVRIRASHVSGPALGGTVSASGGIRMVARYRGMVHISTGSLSSRSGRGSFSRSDGCTGTWTASR